LKYIEILNFEELKTHQYLKYRKRTTRHGNKCAIAFGPPMAQYPYSSGLVEGIFHMGKAWFFS
jgi:hypothetical protein